jgi:8-oxo-dGTP pyrophosphatase MutT (NUDIX family)
VRELNEEAGLRVTWSTRLLAEAQIGEQHWRFVLCDTPALPHQWLHWCRDDGGHLFRFFWHPLDATERASWHPNFQAALALLHALDPQSLVQSSLTRSSLDA